MFMGSKFGTFEGFRWVHSLIMVDEPRFGSVWNLKFGFSRVGPKFDPFLAEQILGSSFSERLKRVWSSVLGDKHGFERVSCSTCQVRSSLKFIICGFDPTINCNGFYSLSQCWSLAYSHSFSTKNDDFFLIT